MTAAASYFDLAEELIPVSGCLIQDSEDEELYPALFWIFPTVAVILIAHGIRKILVYYTVIYINVISTFLDLLNTQDLVSERWNETVKKLSSLTD
jgi:hypothetical protein